MMAMGHDLAMAVELPQPIGQLSQRDEHGAVDVGDLVLVGLTDVDHQQVGVALPFVVELLGGDLGPIIRRFRADPAEGLVVDELGDGRMRAAHRAVGILLQRQLAELQFQRIEQEQAPDERLARAEDELDGTSPGGGGSA